MTQKHLKMGSIASELPAAPRIPVPARLASVELRPPDAPSPVNEDSLEEFTHHIDDLDLGRFLRVAERFGSERFGFVVTPNVDHLIRCHEDPSYLALYQSADFILLDSRFTAYLMRAVRGLRLPVCPGSDVLPALLSTVVRPSDRLVLIGGNADQAAMIAAQYGIADLRHHNPPMGFINDPAAVEECLEFIESASPFRFCVLGIGAPQQERIAHLLKKRGRARGLALCLGASLNFITGVERRAPRWMQLLALEWLYRLTQDPGRLAKRYLLRGPRFFGHMRRARIILRSEPRPSA
jgi:N-acetylglucosaminyldiphosphoundecaprenol N-acetyl-beta-D-mannosaminyltransferase